MNVQRHGPGKAARLGVISTTAALVVLGLAATADAHVRVGSEGPAVQGQYAVLVFRVPSEENANTVKVSVTIPAQTPLASVSTMPMTGWTVSTTDRTLPTPLKTDDGTITTATATITWTAAAGGGVPPKSFQEFKVSAGPLPNVTSMAFPAVQTYSNGDVVRWIEPTPASGAEPDHPVPVLQLAASVPAASDAASATTGSPSVVAQSASRSDDTARGLGIAGIVVGALGLLVAIGAVAFRRRTP